MNIFRAAPYVAPQLVPSANVPTYYVLFSLSALLVGGVVFRDFRHESYNEKVIGAPYHGPGGGSSTQHRLGGGALGGGRIFGYILLRFSGVAPHNCRR